MGILFTRMFSSVFCNKESCILVLGLDNAGKTIILYRLQIGEVVSTIPTIGFNVETVQYNNINFQVGDRCQVEAGEKRVLVKYAGRAESLGPGYWVRIQYDEPLGKHDGMHSSISLHYTVVCCVDRFVEHICLACIHAFVPPYRPMVKRE